LGVWNLNGIFYSLHYDLVNDLTPVSPLVIGPAIPFTRKKHASERLERIARQAAGQS
jgi:hypothetical protein